MKARGWLPALLLYLLACPTAHAYAPQEVWSVETAGLQASSHGGFFLLEERLPYKAKVTEPSLYAYQVLDPITGKRLLTLPGEYHRARVSGGLLLTVRSGEETPRRLIEAWDLNTGKPLWRVPATSESWNEVLLGEVYEGHLFFGDDEGIHKVRVPDATVVQTRAPANIAKRFDYQIRRGRPLVVAGGRVYFADGHRIWGLQADDLSRGWSNYCDAEIGLADDKGVTGIGIKHVLVSLKPDGTPYFVPDNRRDAGRHWFLEDLRGARSDPPAIGGLAIAHGLLYDVVDRYKRHDARHIQHISYYLAAFDRFSGEVRWKVPMRASHCAAYGDKVVVIARHGGSPSHRPARSRLEVYDSRGNRLWRGPVPERLRGIVAAPGRFAVLDDRMLRCYK